MYKLITDEAMERIIEEAQDRHNVYINYARADDRPFYLFDSWADVEKLQLVAAATIAPSDLLEGYTWADYEEAIASANNKVWRVEWAIGEFGFADQFMPCDHCREAIDMHSAWPNYWYNLIDGAILCYSCLHADQSWQGEYLEYCASSYINLRDHGDTIEIADRMFADPFTHDWHVIGYDTEIEAFPDDSPHAEFDLLLIYADHADHKRLYRAAAQIDPNIQLLIQAGRYGQSYIYWARFDPNTDEEIISNREIFDYAIGLVFGKYRRMMRSGK